MFKLNYKVIIAEKEQKIPGLTLKVRAFANSSND
jgi:hypothetical protein